jgi:dTDP-glucose 4,6-dehydratase
MKLLVTGGAGFIGSHFVKRQLDFPHWDMITVLDSLTYAGNLNNLPDLKTNNRLHFVKGDICNPDLVNELTTETDIVVNFAAESHVDRSLLNSANFVQTNVVGTTNLLSNSLKNGVRVFHQVSTDEVYGSILSGSWDEEFPLRPNSPYAASKASADLIALAYAHSFGMDVRISRCSNNYGPNQHPEKLIPLAITNLIRAKKIPIYGDGLNRRDWLYVEDHCRAIELILEKGRAGQIYNVGGGFECTNLEIAAKISEIMGEGQSTIEFVKDRKGHDFRYSVNWNKLADETGYEPSNDFNDGLSQTVDWYRNNYEWWAPTLNQE